MSKVSRLPCKGNPTESGVLKINQKKRLLLLDGEFQEGAGVGAGVELIFPPLEADRDVGLVGGVGGEARGDPRVGGGKVKGGLWINEKIRVVGADHHNQAEKGFPVTIASHGVSR